MHQTHEHRVFRIHSGKRATGPSLPQLQEHDHSLRALHQQYEALKGRYEAGLAEQERMQVRHQTSSI